MKFAIVLAAFVACAAATPYGYAHSFDHTNHWAAPITQYSSVHTHPVAVVAHVPTVYAAHGHWGHDDGSWDHARYGDHSSWNHGHWDGHHAVAHVAVAPVHHSASYVAKTRGSLHHAPLEGHAVSQTSLNLAPAPGTW